MTDVSKIILEKHPVRKTKGQKTEFIEKIKVIASELGYEAKEEPAKFGARNIVIGCPESADLVYTAHYDTCARLPFPNFITPKNILIYILYQIVITLCIYGVGLAAGFAVGTVLNALNVPESVASPIIFFTILIFLTGIFLLITSGPANKHTANDNTSGVCTVIEIMSRLPKEEREKVAFILFDLEEAGLIGSSSYFGRHKEQMRSRLVVNFDCVGDGKHILFTAKKGCAKYMDAISAAFPKNETFTTEVLSKGVINPSDQMSFPLGVGAIALKKTKRGLLYLDRIHTSRDTVCDEENIDYLADGAVKLVALI